MGSLLDALKKQDKKGILRQNITSIGYKTGLLPLDFKNGYQVNSTDKDGNVIKRWANIGLFGGSFVSIIGKSGTAKTAFCVQAAAEICREYKESEIYHLDLEGSSNMSRIMTLTGYSVDEIKEKYFYFNDYQYIEDIFALVCNMADYKCSNADQYSVETNKLNECGETQKTLCPTVIIIDSLPMVMTKDLEGDTDMAGLTYDARKARWISQFYRRLRPVIQRANIIIMVINHINDKVDTNPMAKTQAQIMYLKQNEALPGGYAPIYLTQTLLKFVQCGKYTEEKDGFNGFNIRCEFIKSKTNFAGTSCNIIFDMANGFDKYRTLLEYAKEVGVLAGRNPYSYFLSNQDLKFDSRHYSELCKADFKYYKEGMIAVAPYLYTSLANANDLKDIEKADNEVLKRLELDN